MKTRAKRRQELKRKRMRRVKLMRAMTVLAILVICVGTGVLVSALAQKDKAVTAQPKRLERNDGSMPSVDAADGSDATEQRETASFMKEFVELPEISAVYGIHVNGTGWSNYFAEGAYCMAPVGGYVTAIRATLRNQPAELTGTVEYRVNLSGSGWLDWSQESGETGKSDGIMPLEAVCMRLTGELSQYYDVLYSVLQGNEWTDWVENGEEAGLTGVGQRIDGIRMSLVRKTSGKESYAGGIDPSKPMVALTYDDGPSPVNTPRILDALAEHGARATFFMVGKQAAKSPDVVSRIAAQGCEVANHTYDHTFMSKVDANELTRQLMLTNQTVSDASGISPVLMRPCGGIRNEAGIGAVGAISMPVVMWSIDTLDWKTRDVQNTVSVVLNQVKDGDIILMHDLYDTTAAASEALIPELINRGYQLVTVSELASYRGGMLPGRNYSKFRPVAKE